MNLNSTELAALTATEYAVMLNTETRREAAEGRCPPCGTFFGTLVEDAEFWARCEVHTGLDLTISNAAEFYSDFYKDIYGFRPRKNFTGWTLEEIEVKIDGLFEQARLEREADEAEEAWAAERAAAEDALDRLATLEGDAERYEAMAEALGY